MKTCRYEKGDSGAYNQDWTTACGRKVRCESPMEVGFSFPPLPNADGQIYCTYCGQKIELADRPIKMNTFDGWKAEGFHVMRGEKHTTRNEHGIPLFSEKQVAKTQARSCYDPGDYDEDEMDPWWLDKD